MTLSLLFQRRWRQLRRPRFPGPQSELRGRQFPLEPHHTQLGDELSRGSDLPPGEHLRVTTTWPFSAPAGGVGQLGLRRMPRNSVPAPALRACASQVDAHARTRAGGCMWACHVTPGIWLHLSLRSPESVPLAFPASLPLLRGTLRGQFSGGLLHMLNTVAGVC